MTASLHAPFDELEAEILAHRKKLDAGHYADDDFRKVLPALPLLHRLGRPFDDSPLALVPAAPKAARAALGTDECIFASVGVAAYLDPPVLLVFGPMDEVRPNRLTAPWDTRGIAGALSYASGSDRHRTLIERYSLPGGLDERYLEIYLATLYEVPSAFLAASPPTRPDHLGVIKGARELNFGHVGYCTPEARFTAMVTLDEDTLLAAFVDVDALRDRPEAAAWLRTVSALKRRLGDRFIPVERTAGTADLRDHSARYIYRFLQDEGVLG